MRINEFLSELLDRPLPIKWEEEPGYVRAYFDVNGKEGMVKFYYEAFVWTIDFFIDGRHDTTGQGDELAILSTVSKAILEFISKHNPNLIAFSARGPSRVKLYKRMIPRLTGYTIDPELSKQAGFGLKKIKTNNLPENFTNYQGVRPPKNVPGTNLFPGQDLVGQRVYHCTNRLEAIKKSGGLKPRRDATGEREYGRLSTDEHPFIPVIGIWFSVGKPDWPGKHCVSFVIEPTDQVYVAYANTKGLKPNVVLNPIALDRLTVEGQQDVAENFANGRHPGRKGLAKRSGVNTKASISSLRNTAKHSSGEKQRMSHWLANMKAGRAKNK